MAQSYEAPSPHFTSVLFRVAYLPLPFLSVLNQTINGYKLSACVAMDRNAVNGILCGDTSIGNRIGAGTVTDSIGYEAATPGTPQKVSADASSGACHLLHAVWAAVCRAGVGQHASRRL